MVEVVLSLKTTGQHVSVPLRVQTRTTLDNEDDAPTDGPMLTGRMRGGLWPSLSWLHLLLLIFLTFMLLLACEFCEGYNSAVDYLIDLVVSREVVA